MAASRWSRDWEPGNIFRAPVAFLRTNERGVFECNPDVIRQLNRIDKLLVVIAITGKYRTGKSYLMNRLAGKSTGFPLGSTIESKTKGIWIWCRQHPYNPRQVIVLLDTEGLGDVLKVGGRDGDMRMMMMALLLSSCFVYNILNVFDAVAIEKLDFVCNVAEKMSCVHFPRFVLAVRDFRLDLQDSAGRQLTPKQYLEDCLKDADGENQSDMNKTRKLLRDSFRNRTCFIFDQPCNRRTQFSELENLSEADLNPDFKQQSDDFVSRMLIDSEIKKQEDVDVDGKVFCTLVQKCLVDINNGCVPSTQDMFRSLLLDQNKQAFVAAMNAYTSDMERGLKDPQTDEHFEQIHGWALDLAVGVREQAIGSFKPLEGMTDQFEIAVMEKHEEFKGDNRVKSVARMRTLLNDMYQELASELENGKFHNEWGHDNYEFNLDELRQNFYFSTDDFGGMRDKVFNEFVKEKEGTSKMVKLNQERCKQAREQIKEEKRQIEEHTRQAEAIEHQHREIQEQRRKNQQTHQRNVASARSRQTRDLGRLRSNHQSWLDRQQAQMEKKFREDCARVDQQRQRDITRFRQQMDNSNTRNNVQADGIRRRLSEERNKSRRLDDQFSKH